MLLPSQNGSDVRVPAYVSSVQAPESRWNRLHFGWGMTWIALAAIPFSLIQLIAHPFSPTARNFKRWATGWGWTTLRGIGVRVRVTQRAPGLRGGRPCVFVANHQNLIDVLALAEGVPYPFGFVAKAELERVPFIGFAIRNSACLFIDRSDPRRMITSMKKAAERIRKGNSVLIYPEGERSYGPFLLPFMKGAFALAVEAGVPVVPVTVVDAYRLMDEGRRVMRPGTVRIVVGTPIPTEGLRRRDLPDLMADVRVQIETELKAEQSAWNAQRMADPVAAAS